MIPGSRLAVVDSYGTLLAALLILLVGGPVIQTVVPGDWLVDVLLIAVLVTAMVNITGHRRGLALTLALGIPAVIGRVVVAVVEEPPVAIAAATFVATTLLMARILGAVARDVLTTSVVTGDVLAGAVCLYLLLGLTWALGYTFLLALDPGAIAFTDDILAGNGGGPPPFSVVTYFSFVTLTTLGYGDVSPISPVARNLAWLEAVFGQLFVAITIARLVSQHVAHRATSGRPPDAD